MARTYAVVIMNTLLGVEASKVPFSLMSLSFSVTTRNTSIRLRGGQGTQASNLRTRYDYFIVGSVMRRQSSERAYPGTTTRLI